MAGNAQQDWEKDFGLDSRKQPYFLSSVDQLGDASEKVPHPHTLRRTAARSYEISAVAATASS